MKQRLFLFLLTIIIGVSYAEAQTGKISGVVISSEDNEPVLGATIFVKGTKTATITDADGKFSFQSIPGSAKTLVISFVGMQTKEVVIKPNLKITLSSDDRSLSEVVVTAMGVTKEKKALGYALQEVKGSTLTETAQTNLGTALSGKVAGMQVSTGGGQLGASQRITIRGNGSLGNNQPLIVVDGVPIANDQKANNISSSKYESVDLGSGLNDIDPDNIESISVLKGPSAALYGMEAGNGVILITTKKGKGKDKGVTVQYDGSFTVDEMYQIPKMQNSYGQGYQGAEYDYKLAQTAGYTGSYQEFAAGGYIKPNEKTSSSGYSYVNGKSGGVNDANDMSWGPRLDAGLSLTQFDSPLDANGKRIATPWVSHSNNIEDFLQTGYSQTHNLSITSVKENSTTRASLGYRDQKGTVPNTDLTKYSAELSSTIHLNKYFDYRISLNYSHNKSNNILSTGYSSNNVMQSILQWFGRQVDMNSLKNNWDSYDASGNHYNWINLYHVNPYYAVNKNTNPYTRDRLFGNTALTFKPIDHVKVEGRLGYDYYGTEYKRQITYTTDYPNGFFRQTNESYHDINADLMASYDNNFGDFGVNAMVGSNYRDTRWEQSIMGSSSAGLTVPGLFTMSNVKGTPYGFNDHTAVRSNSVYGQAGVDYLHQAFLDISMRNDWSSTIEQSFFYPSFSGSWIPTETFKSLQSDLLSYWKVRAGWAKVGSATTAYKNGSYYQSVASTINGVTQYQTPTTYVTAGLRPERVVTWEVGTEIALLKNRLKADFTYYQKNTSDQILSVEVANSTGYEYKLLNAGKITNKGIEIQLTADVLKNWHGISWTSTVNWAKDKSKVIKLYDGLDTYTLGSSWNAYVYAKEGEAWGTIYGGGYTFNAKGDLVVGSDGLPVVTSNKKIGDVNPNWTGSIQNEFTYKNFSIGCLFDVRSGGDIFSVDQMWGGASGVYAYTAANGIRENGVVVGQDVLTKYHCVKADGTTNTTRITAYNYFNSAYGCEEAAIISGSYIKLREAHITYNIPRAWLEKTKFIKSAYISLIGNNLAIFGLADNNLAKIDPESAAGSGNSSVGIQSNSIPPTRSIGIKFGVTL